MTTTCALVGLVPRRRAGPRRTAALWVPDWPVLAAMRVEQVPAHLPAAVHDGRQVLAVSAPARRQGVRRGMRRRAAQQCCPVFRRRRPTRGATCREFEPVVLAAETVVAGVEVARPGLLLLPAGGAGRYHGSEQAARRTTRRGSGRGGGTRPRSAWPTGWVQRCSPRGCTAMVPPGTTAVCSSPGARSASCATS